MHCIILSKFEINLKGEKAITKVCEFKKNSKKIERLFRHKS